VQLLERTTRSVRLTDAGQLLQERGPAALSALADAWEAARRVGGGEAGLLRLAYGPSAEYEIAPRLVEALRERQPDLQIAAEVLPSAQIVQAVLDGQVDAGIARTPLARAGIRLRTVRNERQGVLVPSDHPLTAHTQVDLAAIVDYPILMHDRSANPSHFDLIVGLFRAAGLSPKLIHRELEFDPTLRAVRDGTGVALIGASAASRLAPGLRCIPLADPAACLPFDLVLRQADPSPVAERFEHVAVETAAAEGWLNG
jgi:DNA-binding transcriptional LysR family regulator